MTFSRQTKQCQDTECKCDSGLSRRSFIQLTSALTAAGMGTMPVMAGPFESENEYRETISDDKRLDPAWVSSLYERGQKEVYSDPESLGHIGMPIGGLFAGTVYLGGDGRLWLWEIFNRDQEGIQPQRKVTYKGEGVRFRDGGNYVQAASPIAPFEQGFTIRVGDKSRSLDLEGFDKVTFEGRYPIGQITYRDSEMPVEVQLEAFSPFVPLSLDDSSLPATVMTYRVKNTSSESVEVELSGRIENPVCLDLTDSLAVRRRNQVLREKGFRAIVCSAEPDDQKVVQRPDILFEDFEKSNYEGWTVTGDAFGNEPIELAKVPEYQGNLGGKGLRAVNSHASAPGKESNEKESRTGTLTSRPFTIQRRYIRMLIGGGAHRGTTCVNLLVDGKVVASISGRNANQMQPASMPAADFEGRQGQLQIVDQHQQQGWSNIGVDQIVFTDIAVSDRPLEERRDFGTISLALLGPEKSEHATACCDSEDLPRHSTAKLNKPLVGSIGRTVRLDPGEETTINFSLCWHFPNFYSRGVGGDKVGHHYASRFGSASDVARYLADNLERLTGLTRLWTETWYDSSLPYWLLDRTMANTSTLATTTCYRFEDGRFWAWEGIGCCPGTCTHVWHYAQAPGRLFGDMERQGRRVNFGIGLHKDGSIGTRTNLSHSNHAAVDGHCGRILGVLREHQTSTDDSFLKDIWPKVKQAIEYLLHMDGDADGILEGAQSMALDATWFGKISYISSLYLAALRAGETMAQELGDSAFAKKCQSVAERGARNILELYDGEYFIQIEDSAHLNEIGVGPGCYIDQVFGQSWSHWVNLGTLFDRDKQLSALRAIWKYNFVPDVGPFRERFKAGRWYAMAGDAGLLMCTWPKGGRRDDWEEYWQYGYFNECMSGFEWQVASQMIWEGGDQPDLLQAGLAISRAIHDRYNAAQRNPYNEIECSDHYSRAMASYGVFQAVTGFNCHGPKGHIEFFPRLHPDNFKSAFTAAGAWGTITQQQSGDAQKDTITVRWGKLSLKTLAVKVPKGRQVKEVTVTVAGRSVAATHDKDAERVTITMATKVAVKAGQSVAVNLTLL